MGVSTSPRAECDVPWPAAAGCLCLAAKCGNRGIIAPGSTSSGKDAAPYRRWQLRPPSLLPAMARSGAAGVPPTCVVRARHRPGRGQRSPYEGNPPHRGGLRIRALPGCRARLEDGGLALEAARFCWASGRSGSGRRGSHQ